jgi:hypothetical protein
VTTADPVYLNREQSWMSARRRSSCALRAE